MYRAFALKALRAELPLDDSKHLRRLAHETTIRLEPGEEENRRPARWRRRHRPHPQPYGHRGRIARERLPRGSRVDGPLQQQTRALEAES